MTELSTDIVQRAPRAARPLWGDHEASERKSGAAGTQRCVISPQSRRGAFALR